MASKGPRRKRPSNTSVHKRAVRRNRVNAAMPPASDVEVRDADGNVIRVERSKKPLT